MLQYDWVNLIIFNIISFYGNKEKTKRGFPNHFMETFFRLFRF